MAITDTKKYTVQEKLNKMDVDLISVTPTVSTGSTDADADLLFDSLEIEMMDLGGKLDSMILEHDYGFVFTN